jgi:hypothetical protein
MFQLYKQATIRPYKKNNTQHEYRYIQDCDLNLLQLVFKKHPFRQHISTKPYIMDTSLFSPRRRSVTRN